jgi:hypothetical protein
VIKIHRADLACADRASLERLANWIGVHQPEGLPINALIREIQRRMARADRP